ncbi:putative integral membrane protein duf92 protein [Phaeoacremonium minimum UCRPA7]|uniref:Putative integral membrane protein duf92 protein n=1 Tax=Phaeoacremonium minimum (strain UCR-PA7) TaxID=1286976 RepID=R8BTL5_PHAM7|nr:putative integral membrane protein duf92 protein [Phaeoacremonium minimum UCRPA7]EOO02701.1 putative integral membrane protein duf92 protein [Phaeoacremonium minimum UCRPA7]
MKPAIAIPATLALVYRAYSKKSLTPAGIVAATLTAIAHAVKEDVKAKLTMPSKGTAGGEGPRTHVQVFANSIVASVLSLLHAYQLHQRKQAIVERQELPSGSFCYSWGGDLLVIGIIANYACVAADTFSSELGILAKGYPRLITSPTLRKVPPGTNGGVTLTGLAAGLLGSMILVVSAVLFLPLCNEQTAGKVAGGSPWTQQQRNVLMIGLTLWGALGSLVDSFLGGMFQRSVKDVRSGKIVEGEGGVRVLVSSPPASAGVSSSNAEHHARRAEIKAALLGGEGKNAVEKTDATVFEDHDTDKYSAKDKHRKPSFGDEKPTRIVESGWDLLDNNDVNFLMAFSMSMGAMGVAAWYWGIAPESILAL